ncbi:MULTISPECIES: fumarylacetoacetate hydrolase family protein [unclassified Sphingomonas]|uniref:2-keto-4-pentenoate hydratase n=1 Tax=unclassified Sphingomonas TaxID=196159 RepID=UPI000929DB20|nr:MULTISPECIES: fumarylacetoacetate hydrolase family protein [unclassified Sphingomonas]OJU20132.1 MAG: 2-keto-4-pentenoate hydratase [Sphingomonas sp. 66-10]
MTSDSQTPHIARAFVEARRAATPLPDFPGAIPATLDAAYAIQNVAIELAGQRVVGWKVGRINPPVEGVDRLAGPIFAQQVFAAAATPPAMPIYAGGFGAAEAEFLLRIGTAPAEGQKDFTPDEVHALIDAVHIGIEIASSPFPGINDLGPTVTIADFGNNNGLVIGAAIDSWRAVDFNHWPVALRVNGEVRGEGIAADMLDGPIGAARFLFRHAAARGIKLSPGDWISTGAVTGVHPVTVGDRIEARFDDRLSVSCTIEAQ